MKESKDEYVKRLHCGHVSFDELANWYYRLEKQNKQLKRAVKRLMEWMDDIDYLTKHKELYGIVFSEEDKKRYFSDIKYAEKVLKEKE